MLIFRKAAVGQLKNSGLQEVYKQMSSIDVDKEGVKGAKNFFEAKVECNAIQNSTLYKYAIEFYFIFWLYRKGCVLKSWL